jgi:hemoglobin
MIDRQLPSGATRTGASPEFDCDNVPAALLADHRTAAGVYGLVVVLAGEMDFVFAQHADQPKRLSAGDKLVVRPDEAHRVVPGEGMRFQIEFYRFGEQDSSQ